MDRAAQIVVPCQETEFALTQHLLRARIWTGHDSSAGGHRLDIGHAEAFVEAGEAEDPRAPIEIGEGVEGDFPEVHNPLSPQRLVRHSPELRRRKAHPDLTSENLRQEPASLPSAGCPDEEHRRMPCFPTGAELSGIHTAGNDGRDGRNSRACGFGDAHVDVRRTGAELFQQGDHGLGSAAPQPDRRSGFISG
jgi:hypothetical protein